MAVKIRKVTDEDEAVEPTKTYLYRVTFKGRAAGVEERIPQRVFVTFGASEIDAIQRIVAVYEGSSFRREFNTETATAEFILAGVLKVGGQ